MATMTAAQRREAAKAAFDEYMAMCPSHQLLEIIGSKWVSLVLSRLADGPLRYAELARALPGASAKMLTQTLRTLERDGFVARDVTPAVPVQVSYSLTPLGERIVPLLAAIKAWADEHIGQIHAARDRYDASRV
ncbi:transcriptional regulator [Actinomadura sp. NBRC 104425]|uniref:winged helix-turn-helix transcriptional regulator n=1 Tax=Actinomadura sp. NBRC 104425 TaxID=3032204 RepID=UPI0024A484ED|nr:helix-turn-helix domain-containing protein [Actinomadura sp. NBRC 104425]GLZ13790.1 transcriptional regulator [Actinomadura sp. NBRC 104425]